MTPPMPAKIYSDKDGDLKVLKNKTAAVIGFGSQGHAHALNLKESGVKVIIGLYPGSKSIPAAEKYGFKVYNTAEAVKKANIIFVAVPDITIASFTKKTSSRTSPRARPSSSRTASRSTSRRSSRRRTST